MEKQIRKLVRKFLLEQEKTTANEIVSNDNATEKNLNAEKILKKQGNKKDEVK